MLIKTLVFLFTLMAANFALGSTSLNLSIFIEPKGFRLPLDIFSKHFFLMNLDPSHEHLKNHIINSNARIPAIEALIISKNIIKVSECLEIDPWILTGLIKKESSFDKNAVSKTGAVGLTQFTTIGLKEVNDQLGRRGRVGAPDATTLYLAEKIRSCIDPNWTDLWNRIEEKEESAVFYNQLKSVLKKDIRSSIVYGAILLKTYLAIVYKRNPHDQSELRPSDIYFQALQIYNGEAGQAKVSFAKDVFFNLKSTYPLEVNFPFLYE